ncbi:MAG: HAMP domain-containing histidine kinase [Bradyrhizobiaceae bacterium]|nr:HAMP domain-containing histidine kinase [Bradyrhizobiaceae bacterium]
MSAASAARSTASRPIPSSTPSGASGFASVLLTKTLRSSTLRLALICIGVFGTVVCLLFAYVYWSTASYLRSRSDHAIAAERAFLRHAYDDAGRQGLIKAIGQRVAEQRLEGGLYLLADGALAPVAGNLTAWPSALKGAQGWGNFDAPEWKPDATERPLLRAVFETLPDGSHLLVGKDIDDLDEFAGQIMTALTLSVLFTFVLAGFSSIFVTRRTVARIEAINATSRAIMHSGLGQRRIPCKGSGDEWDHLAENLNRMLDRIEGLVAEVKEVSDNVAHDLRTPLARMRGRLEKAYVSRRDDAHDQALIGDTLADLDAVLRMFTSLTRISQIETSDRMAAFRTVNLAHLAREVAELFDAAAEEKGGRLCVTADQPVLVTGDRDLLFDAVANLIDNAIKHGRDAGKVTVEVGQENAVAVISIADDGPGIPASESQQVFKRFYRLERSRRTPGNGLGLSLVAAVARLHDARIELVDNAPGLRFRLVFSPLAGFERAPASEAGTDGKHSAASAPAAGLPG